MKKTKRAAVTDGKGEVMLYELTCEMESPSRVVLTENWRELLDELEEEIASLETGAWSISKRWGKLSELDD